MHFLSPFGRPGCVAGLFFYPGGKILDLWAEIVYLRYLQFMRKTDKRHC